MSSRTLQDTVEPSLPRIRIEPATAWAALELRSLYEYRELVFFLTWRDIKVRYKQTALGAAWAIIQPLSTMLVFTLFFGRLAKVPSDGVPYTVFAYAGLVPWVFFANSLNQCANSVVGSGNVIKKVYFPRLVIPLATVLSETVDMLLASCVLAALMAYYGIAPSAAIVWLPVLAVMAAITALAAGLWLAALNVKYRDVRYVVPFLTQFWMFATPVAYPSSLLPEEWRLIYALNPMVGVIEGFRWALLGTSTQPGPVMFVSFGAALAALVAGAYYFRQTERTFADVV